MSGLFRGWCQEVAPAKSRQIRFPADPKSFPSVPHRYPPLFPNPAKPHPRFPGSLLLPRVAPARAGCRDFVVTPRQTPGWLDSLSRREAELHLVRYAILGDSARPRAHSENESRPKATRCSRHNSPQAVARCAKSPAQPSPGAPPLVSPVAHTHFPGGKGDRRRPVVFPAPGEGWPLLLATALRSPAPSPARATCLADSAPPSPRPSGKVWPSRPRPICNNPRQEKRPLRQVLVLFSARVEILSSHRRSDPEADRPNQDSCELPRNPETGQAPPGIPAPPFHNPYRVVPVVPRKSELRLPNSSRQVSVHFAPRKH